ncbi:major paralogous domain-containing protein [Fibrobacter sp. UWH5]|uniref:fibrobacter succinogenes major paralogous domain-containing protein n=1 Tax=Fibrobacter sp. UWH5 TaxID=1896211 RepID=UPI000917F9E7|nr:fibrobacter succinogenes major paralogous domain-containing protein [Fibrobacter sp. UWH5]SHK86827.1 major paralogous domain-containing protein [Fibrobacter sp. UWH5]
MRKLAYAFLSLHLIALMGCDEDLCMKVHHTSEAEGGCNFVFDDGSVVKIKGASCTDSYVVNDSTKWGVKRSSYQTIEQCKDSVIAYKQSLRNLKNIKVPSEVKTVTIGKQVWMAENLNVETAEGSWCYDNKPENCEKYGRLYTWAAAMRLAAGCNEYSCEQAYPHQGLCPSGFHIPTEEEWKTLIATVGGGDVAGKKLKSRSGWRERGNGSDADGFSALPAGYRYYDGYFSNAGYYAYFWSASQDVNGSYSAYGMYLYYILELASMFNYNKRSGYSVRCLQNSNEEREASLVRPSEAGAANKQNQGSVKDSRDGKTYKTVKIGNQTWMAENLNYKTSGSVCYDYKDANCKKYGRLYTWGGAQNACPAGWHLPTEEEWGTLLKNVGGKETADRALKSRHGWNDDGDGFDNYGFSALPAGYRRYYGNFDTAGSSAYFWSASEYASYYAYYMYLIYHYEDADVSYYSKYRGYSVRCLQNSNEERDASLVRPSEAGAANKQNQGSVKDSRDGKTYKTVEIGDLVWMAENLNVKTDEGSWCYDNKPENCEKYGRLYTWAAAMRLAAGCNEYSCEQAYPHQGLCPSGFHIPTEEEWKTLIATVGGGDVAGKKLKSRSGWRERGNGSDAYGFSALPAGLRDYRGYFGNAGYNAVFWSASQGEDDSYDAYNMSLRYGGENAYMRSNYKYDGYSVRCLQKSN